MYKRVALVTILFVPVAAWAFVKPARVLVPELVGVTCVNGTVCIDDVARLPKAEKLYGEALRYVDDTVGTSETKPRVIFCSTEACRQSFGLGRRAGMTIGTAGIVISPHGWQPYYLRHEMIHYLQYEKLGLLRAWREPKWFMEGMAYALSEDPREKLAEPFEQYRSKFDAWYRRVGKERLWAAARKL